MVFDSFFEDCKDKVSESEKKYFASFIRQLEETFEEEKDLQDQDRIFSLYTGKRNSLGKAKFFRQKSFMKLFYGWLLENQRIPRSAYDLVVAVKMEDVASWMNLCASGALFESLAKAIEFVKLVGQLRGFTGDDALLRVKSIVILAWCGALIDDIINFKKSDIDTKDLSISINSKETRIRLEKVWFNILYKTALLVETNAFPSGRRSTLVDSEYLIRTERNEKITKDILYNSFLERINQVAEKYNLENRLIFKQLRLNGMFERTRARVLGGQNVVSAIREETGCDRQAAFGYERQFNEWNEFFFKE